VAESPRSDSIRNAVTIWGLAGEVYGASSGPASGPIPGRVTRQPEHPSAQRSANDLEESPRDVLRFTKNESAVLGELARLEGTGLGLSAGETEALGLARFGLGTSGDPDMVSSER
jgi:hypothetical protein